MLLFIVLYILSLELYIHYKKQKVFTLNNIPISIKNMYLDEVDVNGKIIQKYRAWKYKATHYMMKEDEYTGLDFVGENEQYLHIIANVKKEDFTEKEIKKAKQEYLKLVKIKNPYCSIYLVPKDDKRNNISYYLLIYLEKKSLLFTIHAQEKDILYDNISTFCNKEITD